MKLKSEILRRCPDSKLTPMTFDQLERLKERYSGTPAHLLEFLEVIGTGSIGNSHYMIYGPTSPNGIFGNKQAAALAGIVLVGDDFAGGMEAYDSNDKWRFGTIGGNARFQPETTYTSFVDFAEAWFATDVSDDK